MIIQDFPKIITHIWYWHWERPVKNVDLDCTKHIQNNTFNLEYNSGRWYIGYKHENEWNKDLSTSNKSISIAQAQLKVKLSNAFKQKISKDGQYNGSEYKIKVK